MMLRINLIVLFVTVSQPVVACDSYAPDCAPSDYALEAQRQHDMERMQDDMRRMQQQRELEYRYGSDGGITRVH